MRIVPERYDPPILPGHQKAGLIVRRSNLILGINGAAVAADCGAVFGSRPGQPAESHRYVLWRMWEQYARPLVVIGLNPSTADELQGDRTVNKCVRWAMRQGLGGLVMLNLLSYRTPYPAEITRMARASEGNSDWPAAVTGGELHDLILCWHARNDHAGLVLYAWGADGDGWGLNRATAVDDMLRKAYVQPWCLDLTKAGYPRHPLYMPNDTEFQPYERAA